VIKSSSPARTSNDTGMVPWPRAILANWASDRNDPGFCWENLLPVPNKERSFDTYGERSVILFVLPKGNDLRVTVGNVTCFHVKYFPFLIRTWSSNDGWCPEMTILRLLHM
jgi:hypothetical protein